MTNRHVPKSTWPRRQAVVIILLLAAFVLVGCPNPTGSGGNDSPEDTGDEASVQFTVSYDGNGATSGTPPANQNKTEGTDLVLATNSGNLARDAFTFAGWNTSDDGSATDYAEGATYSADADLTLYAKWTALPIYTVSYNANVATSGTAPGDQTKTEGTDLTLANNSGNLVRDGFTFTGWNTAIDGSGTSYAEGATYSADAELTLYAEWEVATYTVTYNANGADSGSVPADQTKTHGTALTLANNTGSLDIVGYQTFAGWNTSSDGTGTSYKEGSTYWTNANLTLYAQWSAIGETGEAGGIIFYDDEADGTDDITGARFLEAAPSDIDVSSDYWHVWGGRETEVGSTAQGTAIGTGEANTAAIVAAYGASEPYENTGDYAARLADQYAYGGYSDWFLPSKDELVLMYQNKEVIGGFTTSGSHWSSPYYWSSSEGSAFSAWSQRFNNGFQGGHVKDISLRVRAVRAF